MIHQRCRLFKGPDVHTSYILVAQVLIEEQQMECLGNNGKGLCFNKIGKSLTEFVEETKIYKLPCGKEVFR